MKHTSTRTALRLAAAFAALFALSLAGIGCDSNGGDDMDDMNDGMSERDTELRTTELDREAEELTR